MKTTFCLLAVLFALLFNTSPLLAEDFKQQVELYSFSNQKDETLKLFDEKKITVFIFISKDCPCSQGNMDYINSMAKEFPEFRYIGIHAKKNATNEAVNKYLESIKDLDLKFPIYNDQKLEVSNIFGALKTPHIFILNTTGELIYDGGVSNSTFPKNAKTFFLKETLTDLSQGKSPRNAKTKTLGCFISR